MNTPATRTTSPRAPKSENPKNLLVGENFSPEHGTFTLRDPLVAKARSYVNTKLAQETLSAPDKQSSRPQAIPDRLHQMALILVEAGFDKNTVAAAYLSYCPYWLKHNGWSSNFCKAQYGEEISTIVERTPGYTVGVPTQDEKFHFPKIKDARAAAIFVAEQIVHLNYLCGFMGQGLEVDTIVYKDTADYIEEHKTLLAPYASKFTPTLRRLYQTALKKFCKSFTQLAQVEKDPAQEIAEFLQRKSSMPLSPHKMSDRGIAALIYKCVGIKEYDIEKDRSLRGLFDDLRHVLYEIAPSGPKRMERMQQIIPRKTLVTLVTELEKDYQANKGALESYKDYMQGVKQRVDNFASIFPGGRESWGFVHGVDHEDLRDLREYESQGCNNRQFYVDCRNKLYLTLKGMFLKGDPYLNE